MSKQCNPLAILVTAAILAGALAPQTVWAKGGHRSGGGHSLLGQKLISAGGRSPFSQKSYSHKNSSPSRNLLSNNFSRGQTKSQNVTGNVRPQFQKSDSKPDSHHVAPVLNGNETQQPIKRLPLKTAQPDSVKPPKGSIVGPPGPKNPSSNPNPTQGKGHHHHANCPWPIFLPLYAGGYRGGYCPTPNYPVQQGVIYNAAAPQAAEPVVATEPADVSETVVAAEAIPTSEGNAAAEVSEPVEPAAVADVHVDLVLEDLQYVEPATKLVGPAYRVKFRNQSLEAVGSFRVAVLAGLNGEVAEDAPRAIVEVAGLSSGEAGEVTIRLPRSAVQMTAGDGTTTTFTHLFVAVDLDGTIRELDKTNNVAIVEREVLQTAAAR